MKKNLIIITVLLMIITFSNLIFAAETNCPFGEVECTGLCGQFIDKNNNGICDSSETSDGTSTLATKSDAELKDILTGTQMRAMTVTEVAETYHVSSELLSEKLSLAFKVNIKPTDKFQLLHDNYGIGPENVKEIIIGIIRGSDKILVKAEGKEKQYYFEHISIVLLVLYIISYFYSKKESKRMINHKKFWNLILLIAFLGVGLSGLFLVVRITYGFNINLPFNILFWHVETGIIMAIISIFHILWHTSYFKSYLKFRKKSSVIEKSE